MSDTSAYDAWARVLCPLPQLFIDIEPEEMDALCQIIVELHWQRNVIPCWIDENGEITPILPGDDWEKEGC